MNRHKQLGAFWRVCGNISIGVMTFESSMAYRSQEEDPERGKTLSESYWGSLASKTPKGRISERPGYS